MKNNAQKIKIMFYDDTDILFEEFLDWHYSLFEVVWTPATDLFVTEESIYLMMEIPGVNKEDLTIMVAPSWVHIRGMKQSPSTLKQGINFYKMEIPYGFFQKRVMLPFRIEPKKVKVTLKDGLLTLEFKRKEKGAKVIKVE
jgi:HSP20 family protein|uniref:Hsp20/alpha crystallin family protein n=1 Tax=candidate division WOR-3 bacterium TaxID=2052148 RepID=A0A7C6ECH7_UNCW3